MVDKWVNMLNELRDKAFAYAEKKQMNLGERLMSELSEALEADRNFKWSPKIQAYDSTIEGKPVKNKKELKRCYCKGCD
jgi:hypothetical protein